MSDLDRYSNEDFCYVTTRGRVTGKPHEIEIWFVVRDGIAYLMSGGTRSDWLLNLQADADVMLRIRDRSWAARARIAPDQEDLVVRRAMAAKYQGWADGKPLSGWARTALVVAVEPV